MSGERPKQGESMLLPRLIAAAINQAVLCLGRPKASKLGAATTPPVSQCWYVQHSGT